jgi:hypothetical protein
MRARWSPFSAKTFVAAARSLSRKSAERGRAMGTIYIMTDLVSQQKVAGAMTAPRPGMLALLTRLTEKRRCPMQEAGLPGRRAGNR